MGAIFSKPKVPPPPPLPKPVPMPDEGDIQRKKREQQAALQQRSGRQSTFLTGGGDIGL